MTIEPIREKLDDKIAKLNSSRVIKKITPRGDLSWYVKWVCNCSQKCWINTSNRYVVWFVWNYRLGIRRISMA